MHGGILGLRGNTLRFPLTAKILTQYAKQWIGDMPFTSVALLANLATPLHSDRNNAKGFDNFLIGVSQFKDGGLWLENPRAPHQLLRPTPTCQVMYCPCPGSAFTLTRICATPQCPGQGAVSFLQALLSRAMKPLVHLIMLSCLSWGLTRQTLAQAIWSVTVISLLSSGRSSLPRRCQLFLSCSQVPVVSLRAFVS